MVLLLSVNWVYLLEAPVHILHKSVNSFRLLQELCYADQLLPVLLR